jgi:hypothetical protein
MMQTWHPAAKGDLAPARRHAARLAERAEAWAADPTTGAPAACTDQATRDRVAALATDARAFATLAAATPAADDATLTAALRALHDRFEPIEHGCGGEHGMEHGAGHGAGHGGMEHGAGHGGHGAMEHGAGHSGQSKPQGATTKPPR